MKEEWVMGEIDIERLKVDRAYWDEVAPEGATHYCDVITNPFLKCIAPTVKYWSGKAWVGYGCRYLAKNHIRNSIPRPTKQEWDGESWPIPIGAVFENSIGEERTVVAHDQGLIVCRCGRELYRAYDETYLPKFRPLRTKQQRQRDELAALCDDYIKRDDYGHNLADAILSRYNLEPKQ
jgi:hypothetical protein